MRTRIARLALVASLFAAGALGMAARCIENVSVLQDEQGYTYLLGEIYNDTDVQATRMVVRATLKDATGNVIATRDTQTCPPDLQPHGLSSYAVRFDQPNLHVASWDVRPVAGVTLPTHLPETGIAVASASAKRNGSGIDVTFKVRNESSVTYVKPQLCAVMYKADGKVGSWSPFDPTPYVSGGDSTLRPGSTVDMSFHLKNQSAEAASVRVWLWIPDPDHATSPYQPVMTAPLAIAQ